MNINKDAKFDGWRRIAIQLCAVALLAAFVAAISNAQTLGSAPTSENQEATRAGNITPPPVPTDIQVTGPNKVFLVGHAVGSQNYICLPSGSSVAWTLFTPQATL